MTIKYAWIMPFVMPFVFLAMGLMLFSFAGVHLGDRLRGAIAWASICFGLAMGMVAAFELELGSFTIGKGE